MATNGFDPGSFFYSAGNIVPTGEARNFFLTGGDLLTVEEQNRLVPASGFDTSGPGGSAASFGSGAGGFEAPFGGPEQSAPSFGAPGQPSAPFGAPSGGSGFYAPGPSGFSAPGDLGGGQGGRAPGFGKIGVAAPGGAPGGWGTAPRPDHALQVSVRRKTVNMGKKTLLRDVDFNVDTGDFVLILGGSGAGKTTLVRAILGESKAEGSILLNGQNLYTNFHALKSQIGLVPQFLTLRLNDTVRSTVMDAAMIRLGGSFSKNEISQRVDSVLNKVGIQELKGSLIGQLSGGQKKKVSVAVQLVGFQKVFICDEPDSGLDAASRKQLFDILKEISMSGKIVMVITHYPDDAAELFTKVVVLAKSSADKSGHLAYTGNVGGAKEFFQVPSLQEIMMQINPPYEGGRGLADDFIRKYQTMVRR